MHNSFLKICQSVDRRKNAKEFSAPWRFFDFDLLFSRQRFLNRVRIAFFSIQITARKFFFFFENSQLVEMSRYSGVFCQQLDFPRFPFTTASTIFRLSNGPRREVMRYRSVYASSSKGMQPGASRFTRMTFNAYMRAVRFKEKRPQRKINEAP